MCAAPAQHRAERVSHPDTGSSFWAAKDLLDPIGAGGSPRHARKGSPRYAAHVGRVGALAISLGVGLVVVHSPAVAYASPDSDSDSDSASSSAATADAPAAKPRPAKHAPKAKVDSSGGSVGSTGQGVKKAKASPAPDTVKDADAEANPPQPSGSDDAKTYAQPPAAAQRSAASASSETSTVKSVATHRIAKAVAAAQIASVEKPAVATEAAAQPSASATPEGQSTTEAVPENVVVNAVGAGATETTVAPSAPDQTTTVNPVSAFVSTLLTPLVSPVAPAAPAESPWLTVLLAWVRREISHTFFNKTPVVGQITTSQLVTGTVIIDLNESDPNGDPLSYSYSAEHGVVVRNPLDGTFVYQPTDPSALTEPLNDVITITISDSAQTHLTGSLGKLQSALEGIARSLGLAQKDDLTIEVPVTVDPIIQLSAPVVVAVGAPIYRVGDPPVKVASTVTIGDLDSDNLSGATVSVDGFKAGDALGYVVPQGNPITQWSFDSDTGVLTLTGAGTLGQYEEALKAVTFSTTADDIVSVRHVSMTVTDEDGLDSPPIPTAILVGILAPPKLPPGVVATGVASYTEGGSPVSVAQVVEIEDLDSDRLSSATVSIDLGFKTGDVLSFAGLQDNPVAGSYDPDSGVLTLTGPGTIAQYEQALKAVTFSTTAAQFLDARTLSVTVVDEDGLDGVALSGIVVTVLAAPKLPPGVVITGVSVYTAGNSPVHPLQTVTIGDVDSDYLSGATVKITGNFTPGDLLAYEGPISSDYDSSTGTLTLSGTATLAQYEQALKAITFFANGGTGLDDIRAISVTVVDDTGLDGVGLGTAAVTVVGNIAPIVTTTLVNPLPYFAGNDAVTLDSLILVVDDSSYLTGATVRISDGWRGGDRLSFTASSGITGSYNVDTGILTLTGNASAGQYRDVLQSVKFYTPNFTIGVQTRTFTVAATDKQGATGSIPLYMAVTGTKIF